MASVRVVEYSDDEEEKWAKAKLKAAKKKRVDRDAPTKKKRYITAFVFVGNSFTWFLLYLRCHSSGAYVPWIYLHAK